MNRYQRGLLEAQWDEELYCFRHISEVNQLEMDEVKRRFFESGILDPYHDVYRNDALIEPTPPELRRIQVDIGYFHANGKRYFIQDKLSVSRYEHYLRLQMESAVGASFQDVYNALTASLDRLTSGNDLLKAHHETIEHLNALRNSVKEFDQRKYDKAMEFCTLFINHENEDVRYWDERLARVKIEDWAAEGYAFNDFFLLFRMSVSGLNEAYQQLKADGEKSPIDLQLVEIPTGQQQPTDNT